MYLILETLDLSTFITPNLHNCFRMFKDCISLIELDLSSLDTSNVTVMREMFMNCSSLTSLDLSNFDISNVSTVNAMFYGCSDLSSLNLTGFSMYNVTEMSDMFKNCSNLETIYASDMWKVSDDASSYQMFTGCTNIVGGQGTTYNSSYVDKTRAIIDGGSSNPGYLTLYAYTLHIYESVRGSAANINKNFAFVLNVTDNGMGISGNYSYGGTRSGTLTFVNGVATFVLKHNENISISLPPRYRYVISQHSDGYTLSKTNDRGMLLSSVNSHFTDTLEGTTPTGIFLDLLPYIMLLVFGGFGIFLIRKFKYI